MKSVAQKIFITLGFITLITMSVIPLSALAQADNISGGSGATTQADVAAPSVASALGTAIIASISPILYIVMRLIAGFLGLAGIVLDGVIQMTVVDMTANFKKLTVINELWKTIRDLGNMTFIFILLYQGIRMVLGLSGANVKKAITGIILAAILVNFSLMFTKVVIDASNIITLGFYNSISNAGGGNKDIAGYKFNFGFSGAFMKPLGLSGILDVESFENIGDKTINLKDRDASEIIIYVGGSIFMLIAIFVFLAVALLFIIRYLAFILLLIMSPIAFLNFAIDLGSLSKKYWDTLFGQALFGPIYMFLTWIVLSIVGSDGFLNETGSLGSTLANPNKDTIAVLVNFILLIGLLIFSALQAKTFATKGGIVTSKIVDKGTGWVGGAVFGGAARAGTQTFGRIGRAVADSDRLREQVKEGGVKGWIAKKTLQTGKWTADSSFDARNSSALGDQLNKMGAGKGLKGGYDTYLKNKIKEDKDLLELIKPSARTVAEAEARLKSDTFKEEEKQKRDDYFASNAYAEVLAAEEAKRKKALDDAENAVRVNTDKITQARKDLVKITNSIESSAEYKALQARLVAATTDEQRKAVEVEIAAIRAPITTTSAKIDALEKLINIKTEERDRAREKLGDDFKKWQKAYYESWISDEQKELIAIKGGQDEKKYGKGENLRGQIKTREVTSKADEYAKAIGERIGKQRTAWTLGFGIPEFSKERGRALKKGIKKKKSIEDTIKEQVKEEADAEGGDSTDQTPPAPPTPPPAAPKP